ncbi:ArnT family glycosyltransferase [Gemmatimonas groenlandica]|uniref:Glycosyltransferase RgtA/B/C/D-like domain-containing protein n=1 Tax=Gemmatimonas groenlandica TaxID=2732249 RepID=A0A6M4IW08_9BACT|nr:glycosyltransferase family 39 protein [Gemmatimonas groenlandica]QJR37062.1 hypothetical protein HKW67_16830 [Gemmatimonas groenlandica]
MSAGVTPVVSRSMVVLAAAVALGHVFVNVISPFEFHRDEFLYLAMGEHLRLWRMDFPPFIAIVARVSRALFGDSLTAIRLAPALASALIVLLTGVASSVTVELVAAADSGLERERARAFSWVPWLAMIAVITSPVFLRPGNLFQPVVFDQLWWTAALLALLMRAHTRDIRWWIAIGAALGLGLLTKFSIAFIGVGIVAGTLFTPTRRDLLTRWPWLALLLALAIGSPSLVGQWLLAFPIRWQMRDLQAEQLGVRSPLAFFAEQPGLVGPAMLLALAGLVWLLLARAAAPMRAVGIAVVTSWLLLSLNHGKAYYGAPVYPMLFAAGALAIAVALPEWRAGSHSMWRKRIAFSIGAIMLLLWPVALPIALPILSPERTARYIAWLGVSGSTTTNYGTTLELPQDFADMLGWHSMVVALANEWRAMPEQDRADAVVLAGSYGRAGAIDFYGPRYGLPRVVSPAGSYWFFGPGTKPGRIVLALGLSKAELEPFMTQCDERRLIGTPLGVEEERAVPITRCIGPKSPLQMLWPALDPSHE